VELPSGVAYFLGQIQALLLSPGSAFSLTSLFCALVVAALFIVYRRRRKNRRIRLRTIAELGYLYFKK
jgi:hypothetical protein